MNTNKQYSGFSLTRGRLLARNTLINLWGYGLPLVIAVFAIPILIAELGEERFGILALAWVLVGYLSLLDLGLGRALTQLVAERLGTGRVEEIERIIWTALTLMILIGIGIGSIFLTLLPLFLDNVIKIPDELKKETLHAFILLAGSLPIIIISVGLRGVLAAFQRFDLINWVRIPMGIYSFMAPVAALPFTHDLRPILAVIVLGRIVGTLIQYLFSVKVVHLRIRSYRFDKSLIRPLIKFGGWMTVTNAISPVLVYMDRFFISSLISVNAVTYYATPHEVITKLMLISASLTAVLFPAFSSDYKQNRTKALLIYQHGIKYIFMILLLVCLLITTFAQQGLQYWLGNEFAERSALVLQLLTVGVFFTGIGQLPYALIQGAGRPDLTAMLHFLELPLYSVLLYFSIQWDGIDGAAWSWLLRSMLETICLFAISGFILNPGRQLYKRWTVYSGLAVIFFTIAMILPGIIFKTCYMAATISILIPFFWKRWLSVDEKNWIRGFLRIKLVQTNDTTR